MASDLYYKNGKLKAKFIKMLEHGECPCKWEAKEGYFSDGRKIYLRASYIT